VKAESERLPFTKQTQRGYRPYAIGKGVSWVVLLPSSFTSFPSLFLFFFSILGRSSFLVK